ncbi:MAG: biotin--[acetyl-CoA-carboxylase] ligase [Candidatus Omnitrophica bacterium]|nr:biotin--[acetyl-CoA-carboxylase] ligase [Candidatus Omnitrophota bacterium]
MLTRVIHSLKAVEGYLSGEDLSRELKVSRAAVWKYIDQARALGYEIEAVPHRGYCLVSVPDKLLPQEVQYGLAAKKFGCHVHYFDTIASTMDEAFRFGMAGEPEGTVVVAETQTKGRGRMGRAWASPKGKGLYFSIILRPDCALQEISKLTLVAAVAVSEAVEKATGVRALIKWPNDLLLGNRKLCGILTELRAELDRAQFAVVGIGLNVNTPAGQLIPEAASLKGETGKNISRAAVLQEILRTFEKRYTAGQQDAYADTLNEWRARSATIGKIVQFQEAGRKVEGLAVDLDRDGALLVRVGSGKVIKRMAGDIFLG